MSNKSFTLSGNIVDVLSKRIFPGTIEISEGKIRKITETDDIAANQFILPGLIDAHVHIESSMLIPSEFARLAVVHGTVATVSDPHEIANVLGIEGIEFMIENGRKVPFKFYFGASSCVPATSFETAGANLGVSELDNLLRRDDILYMSEMMNYPGVIYDDPGIRAKMDVAKKHGKPIDGHAPGLRGEDVKKYIEAGISTDHECFTMEEALEKIKYGMHILIREGSAAKNFEALADLIDSHPDRVMICSDDRHPNDLVKEHLDGIIRRAMKKGYDPVSILRSCTLNPVRHYGLDTGLLQTGDDADITIVDDLAGFNVLKTFIKGTLVAENGKSRLMHINEKPVNNFNAGKIDPEDLKVFADTDHVRVIGALDGQLVTEPVSAHVINSNGELLQDPGNDLLKLVVMNRYQEAPPAMAFIRGFGLKKGAIASTVAHDSHNIIAVGTNDDDIAAAMNFLIEEKGGIVAIGGKESEVLPLPVAGIMSNGDGYEVADRYEQLDKKAKEMGSGLNAPFMTLSFMALLVIPALKLSDKGLFDGSKFNFTSLELI